ncbi:hypothetical protein MITS9509_01658 [Synechococcus sp. MIT S9509]|nr:hypothetical protein MITS9509_01658 [Synechococcus sp. MIT S9509]
MELCGLFLAELLHRVDHFLLKFLEGTGFAEVDPLPRSILRQVLKVECSFTIGEELNRRGFPALAEGVAEGEERCVFSELPIHRGGITD